MSGLQYFEGLWNHSNPNEPNRFFYEVDINGNVIRQIELFADGRTRLDDVANYPNGATEFGFGTLIGTSFWDIGIGTRDELGQGEVSAAPSSQAEFQSAWKAAK